MTRLTVLPQSDGWDTASLEQFEQVWRKLEPSTHFSHWDDDRRTLFIGQLAPEQKTILRQLMVQKVLKRGDGTVIGYQVALESAIEEFFGRPLLVILPTQFVEGR